VKSRHLCEGCGTEYYVFERKYPNRDLSHDLTCPRCGAFVMHVQKGTTDYDLREIKSEEVVKDAPRCPVHGTAMEVRSGKYGTFWGCPLFPRCNQTKNV
jgi:ssDNA-binding Zn-finger/Zn-ribbon topoisomerase 1